MIELAGTTTLITGGTSGIGYATAEAVIALGGDVVINARHPSDAVGTLQSLAERTGRRCLFVEGDVANPNASKTLADQALDTFGRIDAVVHAAGGPAPGTIMHISPEQWQDAFNVHVHSVYNLFRAVHAALARQGGSMTLLSSVAGLRGCPGTVAYQTVKAALIQMARALARDHAAEGIRVNCVAPGIIDTPFHTSMTEAARHNNITNRIPLRREGTPAEVASMILQLMQNDFVTGETVVIDGGMSMRMV